MGEPNQPNDPQQPAPGVTPQDPASPPSTTPPAPTTDPHSPPASPDDGKGGKDQVLADLARERDKRQALEQRLATAEQAQAAQLDAIAKALGLKPEEADPSALTAQLTEAQRTADDNKAALLRYQTAVEKEVPAHLVKFVTGSTPEEVAASVADVLGAFAATKPTGPRPDPSQGPQGAPVDVAQQIRDAEKAGNVKESIRLKNQQLLRSS